jgi:hypothetical protein
MLTGGSGLLPIRALWDRLDVGKWIDTKLSWSRKEYWPSLLIEQWILLLLYGGDRMDHLPMLKSGGIDRLFGWKAVVAPTTFGRFLRRAGAKGAQVLDVLLRQVVAARWAAVGVPKVVMLLLDSTVVLRYGWKQAGAVKGYNPKKKGRTSHHPLLAFTDTGDCLGVRWRPGNANTAAGFEDFAEELVTWLRAQGVERILVRLDKGFFKVAIIEKLQALGVEFVLKMQESNTLQRYRGSFTVSAEDPELEVAEGARWNTRLLSVRRRESAPEGELDLGRVVVTKNLTIITNVPQIDPLTAWRMYNQGAQVEHRIEEMGQVGAGRAAVDDLGGNALLWALAALAYELAHVARTTVLEKKHARLQVKTLRWQVLRAPGKIVTHARQLSLKLVKSDPLLRLIERAQERSRWLRPVPLLAT